MKPVLRIGVLAAAAIVASMLIWQAAAAQGAPDPLRPNTTSTVAFMDIGILVFREGLECILVLAAVTASMTGPKREHRRPVAFGAAFAFVATLITWCVAVRIVGSLSDNMSALDLQAATGLLAIIVLLVIMNWFFHKIYWGGWIRAHNRRRCGCGRYGRKSHRFTSEVIRRLGRFHRLRLDGPHSLLPF